MSLFELFLIGLGLSMDCFAVAVSFGASQKLKGRYLARTAVFFALFQGIMPVAGWLIGDSLNFLIKSIDHWIAFGILLFIGGKMIVQSFRNESDPKQVDIRDFHILFGLSVATSIDALITGVGFGVIEVNILKAAVTIGVITLLMTLAGARIGAQTKFISGRWAERLGGLVLIGIGTRILALHYLAS